MDPFFSIIIPVYNVDKYLEHCLDSIVGQDFSSYELICVDDGSTDQSLNILKTYQDKHPQIRIKSIENSGTAVARNEGIKMSKGYYLLFVDSDDWIEPNTLEILNNYLKNNPVDILSFNGCLYYEKNGSIEIDSGKNTDRLKGWDYYNQNVFRPRKFHFVCVVIRAYKRSFLNSNDLCFQSGLLHEDNLFTPIVFYRAKSVAEITNRLYYYRIRGGSKMHEYSFKQIRDKCEVNNRLAEFFFSKSGVNLRSISKVIASDYINLYGLHVKKTIGEKQREVIAIIDKEYFKDSCITRRHKFLYLLIKIHPSVYRFYIKLAKLFH